MPRPAWVSAAEKLGHVGATESSPPPEGGSPLSIDARAAVQDKKWRKRIDTAWTKYAQYPEGAEKRQYDFMMQLTYIEWGIADDRLRGRTSPGKFTRERIAHVNSLGEGLTTDGIVVPQKWADVPRLPGAAEAGAETVVEAEADISAPPAGYESEEQFFEASGELQKLYSKWTNVHDAMKEAESNLKVNLTHEMVQANVDAASAYNAYKEAFDEMSSERAAARGTAVQPEREAKFVPSLDSFSPAGSGALRGAIEGHRLPLARVMQAEARGGEPVEPGLRAEYDRLGTVSTLGKFFGVEGDWDIPTLSGGIMGIPRPPPGYKKPAAQQLKDTQTSIDTREDEIAALRLLYPAIKMSGVPVLSPRRAWRPGDPLGEAHQKMENLAAEIKILEKIRDFTIPEAEAREAGR